MCLINKSNKKVWMTVLNLHDIWCFFWLRLAIQIPLFNGLRIINLPRALSNRVDFYVKTPLKTSMTNCKITFFPIGNTSSNWWRLVCHVCFFGGYTLLKADTWNTGSLEEVWKTQSQENHFQYRPKKLQSQKERIVFQSHPFSGASY